MLKVFLVEDESVIREGLRDNVGWQQQGFTFVGEASDGEMALPLIRKTRPDLLITDIKMPFMDGLTLCHIVKAELPDTKTVIISGYDDFDYARRAIKEGVEQYLLKPVTRSAMHKMLAEMKEKIEAERSQRDYVNQFKNEMREYEHFFLRDFFEKLFSGTMPVQEIYEEAQKLSLDINAACYNLVFVVMEHEEALMEFCLRFSEYTVFRWNVSTYGIMIQGEPEFVEAYTKRLLDRVCSLCENEEGEWHVAAGTPVERFSMLSACYNKVSHMLAYRFLFPERHVLNETLLEEFAPENNDLQTMDVSKISPDVIKRFAQKGQLEEITEFVKSYMESIGDALKSRMFRDYVILNARFSVLDFLGKYGGDAKETIEKINAQPLSGMALSTTGVEGYMTDILTLAITCRDEREGNRGNAMLKKALSYIEIHFRREDLSLNEVAQNCDVSPNYFSAMFSQNMKKTFVEYLTEKRMEEAKHLLKTTSMRSAEIASKIGYKDSHYFSFVFKKTQGMTPKEYRQNA